MKSHEVKVGQRVRRVLYNNKGIAVGDVGTVTDAKGVHVRVDRTGEISYWNAAEYLDLIADTVDTVNEIEVGDRVYVDYSRRYPNITYYDGVAVVKEIRSYEYIVTPVSGKYDKSILGFDKDIVSLISKKEASLPVDTIEHYGAYVNRISRNHNGVISHIVILPRYYDLDGLKVYVYPTKDKYTLSITYNTDVVTSYQLGLLSSLTKELQAALSYGYKFVEKEV